MEEGLCLSWADSSQQLQMMTLSRELVSVTMSAVVELED
jgi:hypothetical protein